MAADLWIANTDTSWFDFLASQAGPARRVDEVNFWNPSGRPMRSFTLGAPVFLRLKQPRYALAGYGFFAHFTNLRLDRAWEFFEWRNGAATLPGFAGRIARYLRRDAADIHRNPPAIGCTILRDVAFWPSERWIPWGEAEGWASNILTGKTERQAESIDRLLAEIRADHQAPPRELVQPFTLRDADERRIEETRAVRREGQGTFRARLLNAYGRRCCVTGERTEPVLDAAHIQPYLGPDSNHLQNGLLMTKEFHTLFDLGYMTVTPDHRVLVSSRLRAEWENGKRYYSYHGQSLVRVPDAPGEKPAPVALTWHNERVYKG